MDIVFGAEDNTPYANNVKGLYAYAGDGGISWTNTSNGLWFGNSWGGVELADADEDSYMELYATDEPHGTNNNSGLKVWEFRNGNWTDSSVHVSTPSSTDTPRNLIVTNLTGDSKLDIVLVNDSGMKYYENKGGNPASWQDRSTGLQTWGMFTAVRVADMNKDGLNDIVVTDYSNNEYLYIQSTSGNLWQDYGAGIDPPGSALGVAVGDVNADSHMDIVYGTKTDGLKCFLGNSGGGSGGTAFVWTSADTGLPTGNQYCTIQVTDIDYDGDLDIVAPRSSGSGGMRIYFGNGSENPGMNLGWTEATNTNLTQSGHWYTAECTDINGDGSLDIAAVGWGCGAKAWLNNITPDITPPGMVIDLIVTNANSSSITVNWTAPADNGTDALSGPVKSYEIRYSENVLDLLNWTTATECDNEPTPAAPGTEESYTIKGLAAGTLYYIRLLCNDERPNFSPLSNMVFNTALGILDSDLPGSILDLQAISPTNNSINLTWTAPADNGTNAGSGPVQEYDIRYYSEDITNLTWDLATQIITPPVPSSPGSTELFTVTGLDAETTYYFAIKARDERPNWGWISNSAFNTTLPDPDLIPPLAITDLNAVNPTTTTIDLTWTAVGDDGNIGNATEYDIRYATATITDLNWDTAIECTGEPQPNSTGDPEQFQVTGLSPNTTYYFAIKVSDEVPAWSGLSNIATNTTLASLDTTPPSGITDLAAIDPTTTSLNLTWTAPGDDGGIGTANSYDIRYAEVLISDANWDIAVFVTQSIIPQPSSSPENYMVTGLNPNTTYYFGIKSADEASNWSPLSNIAAGTTTGTSLPSLGATLTPAKTVLNSSENIDLEIDVFSQTDLSPVPLADLSISSLPTGFTIIPTTGQTDASGILIVSLTAPIVTIPTDIRVTVDSTKIGYISNSTWIILTVNPPSSELTYNLRIESSDITITEGTISEGDEIEIEAIIHNTGDGIVPEFTIRFMIDGTQYLDDSNIRDLAAGSSLNVTTYWTATAGNHTIEVILIPLFPVLESDSTDNSAAITFSVLADEPDDEDSDDSDSDLSSAMFMCLIMIIIVVIIVIVVLVLLFKRKKPVDQYPYPPDYYPQSQEAPPPQPTDQPLYQEPPPVYEQPPPPPMAVPITAPVEPESVSDTTEDTYEE
jgi:hypothetical protein